MDPVLNYVLLIAIVISLVYFYFWIRSVTRRIDRQSLDRRLEELEHSVAETTRWLETASGNIREDLERRMTEFKNLIDQAEHTVEVSIDERLQSPVESALSGQSALGQSPLSTTQAGAASRPPDEPDPGAAGERAPADVPAQLQPSASAAASAEVERILAEHAARPQGKPLSQAERRSLILKLAERGLSVPEIAKQLDASRSEVELVVAFRRPR